MHTPTGQMPSDSYKIRDRQKFPFIMIPKAYFTRFQFSWRADKAYMAMKYFAGQGGEECDSVGIDRMATTVGTSPDTIRRGIAELVLAGAVEKTKQAKDGRDLPNTYELLSLEGDDPI